MFKKILIINIAFFLLLSFFINTDNLKADVNTTGEIFLEELPGMDDLSEKARAAFELDANDDLKNEDGISDVLKYYIN
jgi:hypothetical protein